MKDSTSKQTIPPFSLLDRLMRETYQSNIAATGFATPEPRLASYNTFSKYAYINELSLSTLNNRALVSLDFSIKKRITKIAQNTCLLISNNLPIGTGVRIGLNSIVTAKHNITENKVRSCYVIIGFTEYKEYPYYLANDIVMHPNQDVALLIVRTLPHTLPITCNFEDQPAGGYYLAHHAGGLPLQISTGKIFDFDGQHHMNQHTLLADAGPLASGAGIFDGHNLSLIGINTRRTTEFNRMGRRILKLFDISNWIKNYESLTQKSTLTLGINQMRFFPPAPLELDATPQELYSNDIETITWARDKRRAVAIREFLINLNQFIRKQITEAELNIPEFLSCYVTLDNHQPSHLEEREDKSRVNPIIASNIANPRINALAIAMVNIVRLFLRIPLDQRETCLCYKSKEKDLTKVNWAIDFHPIIVGTGRSGQFNKATIARIDVNPFEKFHFYPIDNSDLSILKNKVHVISANKVLESFLKLSIKKPEINYSKKNRF